MQLPHSTEKTHNTIKHTTHNSVNKTIFSTLLGSPSSYYPKDLQNRPGISPVVVMDKQNTPNLNVLYSFDE